MITTGYFERALYPALRVVIKDAEQMFEPEYPKLFNVENSTQAYEEEWTWGGLGAPLSKPEGAGVAYSKPVPGYYTRYNHATYGLGWRATLEMRMYEKYGILKDLATDLGDSVREGIEILVSGILNTSTTTLGSDGVALFSASHPLYRGGLQGNILSTQADLTYISWAQINVQVESMLSNEGRRRRWVPSLLWYHPALEPQAAEILQSPDRPDTANRAKNVLRKIATFQYHYLTSSTMWGIKCARDFTRVFFAMRPTTSKGFEFDSEDFKIKELFALSYGYSDYRGWMLGHS